MWSPNRADVMRENTEAVFAACDAAHGRWAKLLGVRALIHPKLRLQEFLSIYNITQEFITATEKVFMFISGWGFFFFFLIEGYNFLFIFIILFYANINRLVEGWDIAYVEHYSLRPKPLLTFSMNLELVFDLACIH
jgi:hypothetical protein